MKADSLPAEPQEKPIGIQSGFLLHLCMTQLYIFYIYKIALKIWVIVKKGAVNPTHNITLKNIFFMQIICPRNSKTNLSFFLSTPSIPFLPWTPRRKQT